MLNCHETGGPVRRHSALIRVFMDMANFCGIKTILEPLVAPGSGSYDRFDFIMEGYNAMGENLKADVSVRNPCSSSVVANAAKIPLHAANLGHRKKVLAYGDRVQSNERFAPLIFETYGAMHPGVASVIRTLASQVCDLPPESASWTAPNFSTYWIQRLSVCLWRENAHMVRMIADHTKAHNHLGLLGVEEISEAFLF